MKHKYRINPETLALERIEQGLVYWLKRSGAYILSGICLGVAFFFIFFQLFPSPREKQLEMQRQNLETQLELLDKKVNQMQLVMSDLSQRDDNLYRVLLESEPIPLSVRQGATRKMTYYDELADMTNSQLAADLTLKIDVLEKESYEKTQDVLNEIRGGKKYAFRHSFHPHAENRSVGAAIKRYPKYVSEAVGHRIKGQEALPG